jgi:predicted metalloendopeptidase
MMADIQWAFSTLVRSAPWMDEDSKVATLDKAAAVKQFIGFPEWLLDKNGLEEYYEGVSKTRQLKSQNFWPFFWSHVLQNNTVCFEDRISRRLQAFFMALQHWWG